MPFHSQTILALITKKNFLPFLNKKSPLPVPATPPPTSPPQPNKVCNEEETSSIAIGKLSKFCGNKSKLYNIQHFLLPCLLFLVSRAAFVASLNTSLTPSFVFAEHSM